ncbi:hypothetical protein NW766_007068 [Fusarium irregulare]|uniref:Uncharacterized protein n=1 Tax=Fusarium irregulare TaxID=2494466 RepID=A0A9W8U9B3_9HYPO|nr:hypothetical protein NW766_007068 [Fusarium irregulare]
MSTNSNESSDSECESVEEPTPCGPQEIKRQFLDFYNFLTTLHFDKNDLKVPPPDGWPHLTPEFCGHFKADHTIEVLRHLPYFDQPTKVHIHRGSTLLDYTTFTREDFENAVEEYEFEDEYWGMEGEIDPKQVFLISLGGEQGTYNLFLNARDGKIIYEQIGVYEGDHPIQHYFDSLKDMYRRLELIGLPNRRIIDTWGVPEPEHTISLEEVCEENSCFENTVGRMHFARMT